MNRIKEEERPIIEAFPSPLDLQKASIDIRHCPDLKSGLETLTAEELRDLGLTRPNVDTLNKVFKAFSQLQPHQLRTGLTEW